MTVKIKRVYEPYEKDDGIRILIDRLWPRGIKKSVAKIDLWIKDVAPSNELRKFFGHNIEKWQEFKSKYREELEGNKTQIGKLKILINKNDVTLLYAAKDTEFNNAVVLKDYLCSHLQG
jgi:uncharacterized protein YeaO (DUF488 family)